MIRTRSPELENDPSTTPSTFSSRAIAAIGFASACRSSPTSSRSPRSARKLRQVVPEQLCHAVHHVLLTVLARQVENGSTASERMAVDGAGGQIGRNRSPVPDADRQREDGRHSHQPENDDLPAGDWLGNRGWRRPIAENGFERMFQIGGGLASGLPDRLPSLLLLL